MQRATPAPPSSPCDHYNTCNSSVSVSGSVSARKSLANADRAEILRLGSNSKHNSRNFTVFLISGAKASPCSGLVLEVDHWTSSNNEKPFWLTDGIVHSRTAPCKTAHCFNLRWPKMVAISIIASTSSVELKNGNLCARMVSSMTPTDHMSILLVCAVHLRRTSGARNPRVPARFARRDGLWSFLGWPVGVGWVAARLPVILAFRIAGSSWHRQCEQSVPSRYYIVSTKSPGWSPMHQLTSASPKSTSTPRCLCMS